MRTPTNSPCAPAAGCRVTRSRPEISASAASSSQASASKPCTSRSVRERMHGREARQARDRLVHLRVVLHRARAERVEARVDAVVPLREAREVAHHVELGELGKSGMSSRTSSAPSSRATLDARHVGRSSGTPAPARAATTRTARRLAEHRARCGPGAVTPRARARARRSARACSSRWRTRAGGSACSAIEARERHAGLDAPARGSARALRASFGHVDHELVEDGRRERQREARRARARCRA